MEAKLELTILPYTLAVCKLEFKDAIPSWATACDFFSISKTADELSIVCQQHLVPPGIQAEQAWRCFKVKGPLNFCLTGILASLACPLAKKKISIFAISTFDTDYLLVKDENLKKLLKYSAA